MSPTLILGFVLGYFILLLIIAHFTSKGAGNKDFFVASHQSPWYLVAFGMIGASLSGVTFISIPGEVDAKGFYYMQVVLGYLLGYLVIATGLLPLYYRLNHTSIYTILEQRLGFWSYKTGAFFFLISRIIGASFRLYLVVIVLQRFVFDPWNVPFEVTVILTLLLIWIYTFRGGIKTIVWTDTLQTLFMLIAVLFSIYYLIGDLGISASGIYGSIVDSDLGQIFFWDWQDDRFFFKQFFAGAFIAIVMTGLDQDMMQKNLSCKNIGDAQKNMFWFSIILVIVNFIFLCVGGLLFMYAQKNGIAIPTREVAGVAKPATDLLFPTIALQHMPIMASMIFVLGLIAAAYSSADSALTALTTSFCVDFLGFEKSEAKNSSMQRYIVHIGFTVVLFFVIIFFYKINDGTVITKLFKAAGYTYGPLLGLFGFGILTKRSIIDKYAIAVCLVAPILSYIINENSEAWFNGYKFGFEILILNGLLTFLGLLMISKSSNSKSLINN
ncbi:MAG: sodium:solute symporter [Bacteroidia bacterium]|nr:sodium:solute symporter [Bacteroidia bacterium]